MNQLEKPPRRRSTFALIYQRRRSRFDPLVNRMFVATESSDLLADYPEIVTATQSAALCIDRA